MLSMLNNEESEVMSKILIVYYSSYGHVEAMARAQAEGCARVAGVEVSVKRVPELMPLEVAKAAGCKPSIAVRIAEGHHCLHRLWHEVSAARNRGRQDGGNGRRSTDCSSRISELRIAE